ncbi:helix-turn-helix domain-containing protein [uncultured Helicobacter sp.]|uniref:helix-turn-helix domain-containing protein n=1 Tax=uncultured Helicobacter sp. TaxID=175537 RepID=UPI001C3AA820|nr:helix-turn-helix transcriptional regulator [Candidatus Helicobacter avicola]
MDSITHLPRDLQKLPDTRFFSTPHFAFAKYIQTQSGVKQRVYTDMHCLVIVLCGEKVMHTKDGDFVIKANEGLFLQADNYCLSNVTALDLGLSSVCKENSHTKCDGGAYEALLLFFDNVSLLEFVAKHKERFKVQSKGQDLQVFHLRDSDMLSTIARSFELYIQEFREELLPFVSHKFEELFLYLSLQYAGVFAGFLQQIMRGLALDSRLAFLYCEEEFANVAQMAECAKTDQATFSKKFKQAFGLSPKHWLDERRFEKAKFLLEFSNKNINEICAECGFGSPSWFIERFKTRYHCTPKHYQKSKNLYFS